MPSDIPHSSTPPTYHIPTLPPSFLFPHHHPHALPSPSLPPCPFPPPPLYTATLKHPTHFQHHTSPFLLPLLPVPFPYPHTPCPHCTRPTPLPCLPPLPLPPAPCMRWRQGQVETGRTGDRMEKGGLTGWMVADRAGRRQGRHGPTPGRWTWTYFLSLDSHWRHYPRHAVSLQPYYLHTFQNKHPWRAHTVDIAWAFCSWQWQCSLPLLRGIASHAMPSPLSLPPSPLSHAIPMLYFLVSLSSSMAWAGQTGGRQTDEGGEEEEGLEWAGTCAGVVPSNSLCISLTYAVCA